MSSERAALSRRVHFSAAHFYRQAEFSDEENRRVFGLCYTPYGHGHNYVLEAFVEGDLDSETRTLINITGLDRLLKEAVEPFEHHHINFDIPDFRDRVPTTENLALYLADQVSQRLKTFAPDTRLIGVRLYECDSLWSEVLL